VGVLRLGRGAFGAFGVFGAERLLVMAAVSAEDRPAAMERVHAVVDEGADIVWIGGAQAVALVAAVRSRYPDLIIGVSTGRAREACTAGADLVSGSGLEVAAEFGAGVVCPPGLAARAVEAGVEPERIIVGVDSVAGLADAVGTGWPVLVSVSGSDLAGNLATTALAAWLGARVFRVEQVGATRRALRMVSAIRGDVPPACAVRGLAL
jgi:dihydropteroate synthase